MISVLVVGGEKETEGLAGRNPSVEVVTAHGMEDTLEKLGRNRRIDAVLLLSGADAAAVLGAVEEDNPAHPPVFQGGGRPETPGTRSLPERDPGRLLDLVLANLEG